MDGEVHNVQLTTNFAPLFSRSTITNVAISSSNDGCPVNETKRLLRDRERQERMHGKLTDLTFDDISCTRNGVPDFIKRGVLVCVRGSKSQFDARSGRLKDLMPPLTCDSCQTFSTLSAVILSSLGFAVMFSECCVASTVNYLLYISAWMHQLSLPAWPQRGMRPTIGDLNACLHLRDFFPSRIDANEFDIVFYNQASKALDLLRQMCTTGKRPRNADGKFPVCGYVIVSGDYTVSVFSVDHDIQTVGENATTGRYTKAWSVYICDSHGTQPWSMEKASITGLTFGVPSTNYTVKAPAAQGPPLSVEDGIHYFSTILFTLLEEHRRGAPRLNQVPYMTWTPVRRRRSLAYTAGELKHVIDKQWITKVLSNDLIKAEVRKFNYKPLDCFLGTSRTA